MGIRSKFKGKNTKNCILKAVLKKNSTVVVKLCPKNYLFCIPTIFLPQLFGIFTQIYLPHLWHFATLGRLSWQELVMMVVYRITIPLLAMFGIVGNLLNVVILRFLSKMIVLVNVNLFHPSQHQFKDSVYFFLKVASPITFSWSIVFSMILAAWLILRKSFMQHHSDLRRWHSTPPGQWLW